MKKLLLSAAVAQLAAVAAVAQDYDNVDPSDTDITIWYRVTRGGAEAMEAIIADFNATNDFGITATGVSAGHYGEIYDKFMNLVGTDELPNIVIAYQNQASAFETAGGLIDINPLFNSEKWGLEAELADNIPAGYLSADLNPDHDFQRLGFPPRRSMDIMYVNTDWLAELGFDAIPSTPAELEEAACAATEAGFSGAVDTETTPTGMTFGPDASRVASFIFAFGGDVYDYDANQFDYDSDESLAAMQFISDLAAKGCLRMEAERYGAQTDFGNGVSLFTLGSSSGLPFYRGAVDQAAGFEWTISALPHTTETPQINVFGPSFSIVDASEEQEIASWLWMKHFVGASTQAAFVEATNYYPVNGAAFEYLGDYIEANPQYTIGRELINYARSEAPVGAYQSVRRIVGPALAAITEGADVAETMEDINIEANELLEESRAD